MLILLCDNKIIGTTVTNDVPDGCTVVEYPENIDIRRLYYDTIESKVKLIPPRPEPITGQRYVWTGGEWVSNPIPVLKPPVREAYIGSPLYKWAATTALSDNKTLLLHCSAMCADVANTNELPALVKELRTIRGAVNDPVIPPS